MEVSNEKTKEWFKDMTNRLITDFKLNIKEPTKKRPEFKPILASTESAIM